MYEFLSFKTGRPARVLFEQNKCSRFGCRYRMAAFRCTLTPAHERINNSSNLKPLSLCRIHQYFIAHIDLSFFCALTNAYSSWLDSKAVYFLHICANKNPDSLRATGFCIMYHCDIFALRALYTFGDNQYVNGTYAQQ